MGLFTSYLVIVILSMLDKIACQRRITNGENVIGGPKRYMAYLLRAPASPKAYDEWMCGGAIVNPLFILTSAACVEDIEFMYAITGYEKYIPAHKLEEDDCTRTNKMKVVFTCVPKMYELNHEKVEKWSFVDIAAVRVEAPIEFELRAPKAFCTWVPDQIEISFEAKHRVPEMDTMVLGWGHKQIWRSPQDTKDYNQPILQYAPTLILDKTVCKNSYQSVPDLMPVIDRYMICTLGEGNIDSSGRMKVKSPANLDGCGKDPHQVHTSGAAGTECTPLGNDANLETYGNYNYFNFQKRRSLPDFNESDSEFTGRSTRRNGICQNDHGGPLVTWVGGREVVIGVASVFLVNAKDRSCVGPYLHTSTQCNGAFLNCVVKMFDEETKGNKTLLRQEDIRNETRRFDTPEIMQDHQNREDIDQRYKYMVMMNRRLCDLPPEERGFDMIQRRISWMHHPDGPARNEIPDELVERPQIPINDFS